MSLQAIYYYTDLPSGVIDLLYKDLIEKYEQDMQESSLTGKVIDDEIRKSKNSWLSTNHWIAGFLWHYVHKANRENFRYDISHIDAESLQFTKYEEGEFYNWHSDVCLRDYYKPNVKNISSKSSGNKDIHEDYLNLRNEYVRKLSFTLQLSEPDEYEGGNVQFIDDENKTFFAPRQRGSMVLFDSRTQHRVLKVKKGVRRSIVGWVLGPRWK